jgi:hypothetical protein
MSDPKRPHPVKVEAAKEFLKEVAALVERLNVPPHIAVALFGKVAGSFVKTEVKHGAEYPEAMIRYVTHFMDGLGVETVCLPDGEDGGGGVPPTAH